MANRITRIYTRTGDSGSTGLGDGSRVDKSSLRITAIGDVDELNSVLGIILSEDISDEIREHFVNIQHILFDLGAELSLPGQTVISDKCVQDIEILIDTYNEKLPPLKEFILPGGIPPAAYTHLARAVCRRAERHLVALYQRELVNKNSLIFLNRLSDLLFVVSRILNKENGRGEQYWEKNLSNR